MCLIKMCEKTKICNILKQMEYKKRSHKSNGSQLYN